MRNAPAYNRYVEFWKTERRAEAERGYDALLNGKLTHISGPMVWINPAPRSDPILPAWREALLADLGRVTTNALAAAGGSPWNPIGWEACYPKPPAYTSVGMPDFIWDETGGRLA